MLASNAWASSREAIFSGSIDKRIGVKFLNKINISGMGYFGELALFPKALLLDCNICCG
jgi:hypothetical protein